METCAQVLVLLATFVIVGKIIDNNSFFSGYFGWSV